jgi:hypothetical protein
MRADIQRKPLGFQEVTASHYRCVSICVTRLTRSQQIPSHSLVLKTTGILEQPFSTSLLQNDWQCDNQFDLCTKDKLRRIYRVLSSI